MSEFDEMPIKIMKLILEARGISTKGMLERPELEKALRNSTPAEAEGGGGGGAAGGGVVEGITGRTTGVITGA